MAAAPIVGDWGWAASFGDASNRSYINGVAEDAVGNSYAVGWYTGTVNFDPNRSVGALTSAGDKDIFVARYSPAGGLDWVRSLGSTGADEGRDVTVNTDGRIIVTGNFRNTVDFDPGVGVVSLRSAGAGDGFVLALQSDGTYAWSGRFGGTAGAVAFNGLGDSAQSVTTDAAGNIFAAGIIHGLVDFAFGGSTATVNAGSGVQDTVVLSLSPSGVLRFAQMFDGSFLNGAYSIRTDRAGNVIVAGFLHGTQVDFDPGPGVQLRGSFGLSDAYVAKLDNHGRFLWAYAFGSAAEERAIATVDDAGNVYCAGVFGGPIDVDPSPGEVLLNPVGSYDAYVVSLDPNGNYRWSQRFGGGSEEGVGDHNHIALTADGHVVVTGRYHDAFAINLPTGLKTLPVQGTQDTFVVKLAAGNGRILTAAGFGGPDSGPFFDGDDGQVYVAASGSMFFYGGTSGSIDVNPSDTATSLLHVGNRTTGFLWKLGSIEPPPSLSLAVLAADKHEGSGGGATPFTFTVTRSGSLTRSSSIAWAVNGSGPSQAAEAVDFLAGLLPSGSVSFAPGESAKTITVYVSADSTIEADENFTVTLSSPVNAVVATATATGIIRNDDLPWLSISDAEVVEGNSGTTTASLFVTLSAAALGPVMVSYSTLDGTATAAGNDYVVVSSAITFAAGETSKTISVPVRGDAIFESHETFGVRLASQVGAAIARSTGVVTIRNDDPRSRISIAATDAVKSEGDKGRTPFTFTLTRTGDLSGPVSVPWSVVGSGAYRADRFDFIGGVLPSGTIRLAAGRQTQTLIVNVLCDRIAEFDEQFTVTLGTPLGGLDIVEPGLGSATATIWNDDPGTPRPAAAMPAPGQAVQGQIIAGLAGDGGLAMVQSLAAQAFATLADAAGSSGTTAAKRIATATAIRA